MASHQMIIPPYWDSSCSASVAANGAITVVNSGAHSIHFVVTPNSTVPVIPVKDANSIAPGTEEIVSIESGEYLWVASSGVLSRAGLDSSLTLTFDDAKLVRLGTHVQSKAIVGDRLSVVGEVATRQFIRGGSNIDQATLPEYVVTEADVGSTITASADNLAGSSLTVSGSLDVVGLPVQVADVPYKSATIGDSALTWDLSQYVTGATSWRVVSGVASVSGNTLTANTFWISRSPNIEVLAINDAGSILIKVPYRIRPVVTIAAENPGGEEFGVIAANGWTLTAPEDLTGNFDPDGDPETITLSVPGYNAAGAAVTHSLTVYKTARIYEPHPTPTVLTARNVALSRIFRTADAATGYTNNSTRAYEKPAMVNTTPDRLRLVSTTYTARMAASHRHGTNGTPLACAELFVTDGTTTVSSGKITAQTPITYAASGLTAPEYVGVVDITSLDDGPVTAWWVGYPHAGTQTWSLLTDYESYPNQRGCCYQRHEKAVSATRWFAHVDGVGAAPAVATDLVSSRSSGFADMPDAVTALIAASSGDIGACVLEAKQDLSLLLDDLAYGAAYASDSSFVIIGEGTGAILTEPGVNDADTLPDWLIIQNMEIRKAANGNYSAFSSRANAAGQDAFDYAYKMLQLVDCTLSLNGQTDGTTWFNNVGRMKCFNTTTDSVLSFNGNKALFLETFGCEGFSGDSIRQLVATRFTDELKGIVGASIQYPSKDLLALNCEIKPPTGRNAVNTDALNMSPGDFFHVVGCLGPLIGSSTDNNVELHTAYEKAAYDEFIYGCSFPGAVSAGPFDNFGDGGVSTEKDIVYQACVFTDLTMEGDEDSKSGGGVPDGGRTAAWQTMYRVECRFNAVIAGTRQFLGAGSLGKARGLEEYYFSVDGGPAPGWANDASASGTNNHVGGDYRITVNRGSVPTLPSWAIMQSYDLFGTAIPLNGTAIAGAVQGS